MFRRSELSNSRTRLSSVRRCVFVCVQVPCKARHGKTVIARSHEVEIDYSTDLEDADRADEVRIQMAKAMNATVVRFTVPEYKTSPGT